MPLQNYRFEVIHIPGMVIHSADPDPERVSAAFHRIVKNLPAKLSADFLPGACGYKRYKSCTITRNRDLRRKKYISVPMIPFHIHVSPGDMHIIFTPCTAGWGEKEDQAVKGNIKTGSFSDPGKA